MTGTAEARKVLRMTQHVRDVMAEVPMAVEPQTSVASVARMMRDQDVATVLVKDRDHPPGLVTDRDLVVRALATGVDPERTTVAQAMSKPTAAIGADEDIDHAIRVMRASSARRLPVVDSDDRPVGVVCLDDLTTEEDSDSWHSRIVAPTPDLPGTGPG